LNKQQLGRATLALCLGSLIVFANLYATQPLLAIFVTEFSLSELEAARSLTVATLTLGLSLLVYGPLSDAIGRKVVMVGSLCGVTVVSYGLSQVHSFEQLLWLRALHGFLLGGIPATAIAYIGEEFPRTKVAAAIGLYISANSLGGISGRILSGIVSDIWDWPTVFSLITMANVVICLLLLFTLPSSTAFTPRPFRLTLIATHFWLHLKTPRLLIAFIIGGLNFMIFLSLYSYVIFILADKPYSLSSSWLGLLFLTYLSGTIGSAIVGKIDHKISCAQRIIIGTLLIMVGTSITLYGHLFAIIGGLLVNGFGFFIAHSSLSTWVNQYANGAKASASSLYLVFYYLGASAGNIYLYPFWQWGQWLGVVIGALITLLIPLLAALYLRTQELRKQENSARDSHV
jgi:MFS transporter, YNFM family, putative membrane transport protein